MNIKKIIQEEVNDFDWVDEVSTISVGTMFKTSSISSFFYIVNDVTDGVIKFNYPVYSDGSFRSDTTNGWHDYIEFEDKIVEGRIQIIKPTS